MEAFTQSAFQVVIHTPADDLTDKSIEMVHRYAHFAPDYQEGLINVLNHAWHDFDTVGNNVVKVQFGK